MIIDDGKCNICLLFAKNPVDCIKCRNTFCLECAKKTKFRKNQCPYKCSGPFEFSENRKLKNYLNETQFRCNIGECTEINEY